MACSMPFNNKNLDISFFVFKPTVVIIDDLVHELKHFSLSTENLGCVQSSIFRSIHGNMIIWYGAWQKQSSKEKEQLTSTLKSMLTKISSMAVLVEQSFLEANGGESRDGSSTARFSTGDIICLNSASTTTNDLNDLCYAVLAILRSRFTKMEGITAGLCLKGQSRPIVVCIHVWKSLHFCYSWILNSDHRNWMRPYLERFSIDMKYDVFRVVYVSGDNVVDLNYISPHQMLENGKENRQGQAQVHRHAHNFREVQQCTLLSIKTRGCSEDCSYCPQSSKYDTGVKGQRLMNKEAVLGAAKKAKEAGSTRFCMGAAWRDTLGRKTNFNQILEYVKDIRDMGMEVCCTLGMLEKQQALELKKAGLTAYNHNLDTSREYYPNIITTRTYDERLKTLEFVCDAGINVCSGGIIGLGEAEEDRVGLLHTLSTLPTHPESVPINALAAVKGTPLEDQKVNSLNCLICQ
ncbi:hypothetical protein RJT34_13962 [Clitoria ternatea]|uniref:Radical SAM core domain-containing protein n=1 Tax=Clitoria ternatea TaxID=43366 RepID=A0AAN9PMB4_CLITE